MKTSTDGTDETDGTDVEEALMNFPDDEETPSGRQAEDRLIHSELSRDVIGAAMTVSRTLGPGLRENTYERALCLELTARGIPFSQQERFEIRYAGQVIDTFIPDLVVDNAIIVDTKVVAAFEECHEAQMLTYLSITGLRLALLLNFKHRKVTWKRIIR